MDYCLRCFLSFPTGAQQAKSANTENILHLLHQTWSNFNVQHAVIWLDFLPLHCSQEVNAKMLIFLVSTQLLLTAIPV